MAENIRKGLSTMVILIILVNILNIWFRGSSIFHAIRCIPLNWFCKKQLENNIHNFWDFGKIDEGNSMISCRLSFGGSCMMRFQLVPLPGIDQQNLNIVAFVRKIQVYWYKQQAVWSTHQRAVKSTPTHSFITYCLLLIVISNK